MGHTSALGQQRGSVIVTLALVMTGLLSMVALAINGAFVTDVHSELQNTADAMATAATSGLVLNQAEANQLAEEYAQRNAVLGQPMSLEGQSVEIGLWSFELNDFFPTTAAPNSVRVTLRLNDTSSPSAPSMFLAPFLGQQTTTMTVTATASLGSRSIVLTLDRSGSMRDDGTDPEQPLTDTKEAAKAFLDMIQDFPIEGDRMGLVYYNFEAQLRRDLTENFNAVKVAIDEPNARGCTNIAAALCTARTELLSPRAGERGVHVVVLLSDGRTNTRVNPLTCQRIGSTCQDPFNPSAPGTLTVAEQQALAQAQEIADNGAILFTISLGLLTNQALMEEMAALSGGEHFFAPTTDDLDDVFRQISEQIPVVLVE